LAIERKKPAASRRSTLVAASPRYAFAANLTEGKRFVF
jgi:hypothetical protein